MTKADSREVQSLEPQYFFGLTVGSGNNCFFLNNDKIVYRAAGVLVVHDMPSHSQRYVYLADAKKTITTMDLSHNKRFVAVAESGKKPSISVYDLVKSIRLRQLTLSVVSNATSFAMIKFSHDDVYLAALTNAPDYVMFYYEWRKSLIVNHLRVVPMSNLSSLVNDMVLNPGDNKVCCFVGNGLFRCMAMGEVVWKQYGFYKAKKYDFTTACWLNTERLIAGTSNGQLLLFGKAELKAIYNVQTLLEFDPRLSVDNPYSVRPLSKNQNMTIGCCTPIADGMLFTVGNDQVYYYEVSEPRYSSTGELGLMEKHTVYELSTDKHLDHVIGNDSGLRVINTVCVDPIGKTLMCVTDRSRLYRASIDNQNRNKTVALKLYSEDLHHGGVAGLSLSSWSPVFMTCGRLDRTVKLWNYEKQTLLFTERYHEDVLNVSLHPTGQCAMLAFAGSVQFCMVHADRLLSRRALAVKNCSLVRFSRSGQMFALVDALNVDVYCSITFKKLHQLSTHKKPITTIRWSPYDWKLLSSDVENRVCQFDLHTEKCVMDLVYDDQIIYDLAMPKNSKTFYTAGKDGRVREMYIKTMIRNKSLENGSVNSLLLSQSNMAMFAGCQLGGVVSVSLPIMTQIKYKTFYVHNDSVSEMALAVDDATLVTCAEDGSICIWAVHHKKPAITTLDHTLFSSKQLVQKIDTIAQLSHRLDELKDRLGHVTDNLLYEYDVRLRELIDEHASVMKRLEDEREAMIALLQDEETQLTNEIKTKAEDHEIDLDTLTGDYEKKILIVDKKYEALEKEISDIKDEFNKKEQIAVAIHEKEIQDLNDKFIKDLKIKEENGRKFEEDLINEKKRIGVVIDEFEGQGFREVLEMNAKYAVKLKKWTKKIQAATDEIKVFEKGLKKATKTRMDMKHLVDKYQEDRKKVEILNKTLDEDILEKVNELTRCQETMGEKDHLMTKTKLEWDKIEEQRIKNQFAKSDQEKSIVPLQEKLLDIDVIISKMRTLLDDTDEQIWEIRLNYTTTEEKIKSAVKKIKLGKDIAQAHNEFIQNVRIEIHNASLSTAALEKKKTSIRDLLQSKFANDNYLSEGVNAESLRQRQFYESCLAHLTMRVASVRTRKPEHIKMIKDNEHLVEDLNRVKKEAETNRVRYTELECALKKSTRPSPKTKKSDPSP